MKEIEKALDEYKKEIIKELVKKRINGHLL
jgi:hypothetical protein